MKAQTNRSILGPRLQRRLRAAPTEAERLLWRRLCGRQLGDCKFRRQHPFGDYILDFVCLERRLVVELDGSQHAENVEADRTRTLFLEQAGFLVLRFWNNQVFEDIEGVLEAIWQELHGLATPSPPRPSP
ncbi:MAG TPA: endonuclease domain-containing protein [Rhodanobacteraceae bacterium]|nr:endonuclease domain-containing protein [Rhodanobacteraceae bacterium]